ncbi:MAG: aminotransferase class V-fold PLP-dependent enzyme [Vicinamibacterales bacterium]
MSPTTTQPVRSAPAPLAMTAADFRALGHELVDRLAGLLEAVPDGPVTRDATPSQIRRALDLEGALPEAGTAAAPLLLDTAAGLFGHSLFNAHPRFFGYITSSPAPIGMLGDFLASALNANVGAWALSPAATEIEAQTLRWIASFIGYGAGDGVLVSGGNMANMVCFLAARAAKAPWNVREAGVAADGRTLRAYCSAETHTWVQKAADMCGLGTASVRWIPTDRRQRMDVAALVAAIDRDAAAGDVPFLVVGTAGSVSTGAVDPLREIHAVCRARNLWFHVDGAYGALANALPDAPPELGGLALADSVAVDPHKWLYAPLEVGCALVKDADALTNAFAYHPPYYHFGEEATNFLDHGPQNSRGFRALKVWLALKHVGAAACRAMIGDDIALAGHLWDTVDGHPELEAVGRSLSIVTFRYVPPALRGRTGEPDAEARLDAINREILDRLQRGGEVFVSNAVVDGRYLLRACVVNFHSTPADMDAVAEVVVRLGREVAATQAG